MKILAFAASNSSQSINKTLATYAAERLQSEFISTAELEILDLNDFEMPIYSADREKETGIPTQAQAFFDKIGDADAVIASFAEHNGSVTAAWKNIFDWMSRIDMGVFHGKPVLALAASPGPRAGAGVLGYIEMSLPRFGADVKGQLGIGMWSEAWNADTKTLTNPDDIVALDQALNALTS